MGLTTPQSNEAEERRYSAHGWRIGLRITSDCGSKGEPRSIDCSGGLLCIANAIEPVTMRPMMMD